MRNRNRSFIPALLLAFLLLTACNRAEPDNPDQASGEETHSAAVETAPFHMKNPNEPKRITARQAKLVFDRAAAQGTAKNIRDLSRFSGDLFCTSYAGLDGEPDSNASRFAVYDGRTGEMTPVGRIADTNVSSGDAVFMDGRYYYTWYGSADADGADINNLIRIDAKEKQFTIVEKRENVTALINLSKLSATEFIGYVPSQEGDSVVTEIEKYDGKTGKRKTILRNQFFYQEGAKNSRGTVLEVACAADGKLYGLGRQKKKGVAHCYLYAYDSSGRLLSQTEEPEIGKEISSPMHMDMIGNLLILKDYQSLRAALFFRQGEHYVRVFGAEQYDFAGGLETLYDSAKTPYLFFQKNSLSWPEEAGKSVFYAVHTQTGEITQLQADIDPQYPFLDRIHMDENGNLVLVYLQDMYGQNFKAYQVGGAVLKNVLAK